MQLKYRQWIYDLEFDGHMFWRQAGKELSQRNHYQLWKKRFISARYFLEICSVLTDTYILQHFLLSDLYALGSVGVHTGQRDLDWLCKCHFILKARFFGICPVKLYYIAKHRFLRFSSTRWNKYMHLEGVKVLKF